MTALRQDSQGIAATLSDAEGHETTVRAAWLLGCDGARSAVRHALNLPFEGAEYEEKFLLADVRIEWDQSNDEGQFVLTPEGPVLAFPFPEAGRWRLVDTSGAVQSDDPGTVVDFFQRQLAEHGFPRGGGQRSGLGLLLQNSPSRRGTIPRRALLRRGRRGAHPQPGGWPGHEHGHPGRL